MIAHTAWDVIIAFQGGAIELSSCDTPIVVRRYSNSLYCKSRSCSNSNKTTWFEIFFPSTLMISNYILTCLLYFYLPLENLVQPMPMLHTKSDQLSRKHRKSTPIHNFQLTNQIREGQLQYQRSYQKTPRRQVDFFPRVEPTLPKLHEWMDKSSPRQ